MQNSSPSPFYPSTPGPSSSRTTLHQPLNSSPLASPKSSPTAEAFARRRGQYKSRTPSVPLAPVTNRGHFHAGARRASAQYNPGGDVFYAPRSASSEAPQKSFLRERFQAQCLQRAQKARQKAVSVKRRNSVGDQSSDGAEDDDAMDESEEEDDETIMQDELFRRIVQSAQHKQKHSYRVSYTFEVGSSVDPDMEDIGRWEQELKQPPNPDSADTNPLTTPEDLEREELEVYAAEYEAVMKHHDDDADYDSMFEDFDEIPDELIHAGIDDLEENSMDTGS